MNCPRAGCLRTAGMDAAPMSPREGSGALFCPDPERPLTDPIRQGRGATGSIMNLKHKTSQALFAYWDKVRARSHHAAPLRDRARQDRRRSCRQRSSWSASTPRPIASGSPARMCANCSASSCAAPTSSTAGRRPIAPRSFATSQPSSSRAPSRPCTWRRRRSPERSSPFEVVLLPLRHIGRRDRPRPGRLLGARCAALVGRAAVRRQAHHRARADVAGGRSWRCRRHDDRAQTTGDAADAPRAHRALRAPPVPRLRGRLGRDDATKPEPRER